MFVMARKLALATAFALLVSSAQAQQQSDPILLQKALVVLQQQRDAAMNAHVEAAALAAVLAEENAKLRAKVEELQKRQEPAAPAK